MGCSIKWVVWKVAVFIQSHNTHIDVCDEECRVVSEGNHIQSTIVYRGGWHPDTGRLILEKVKPHVGQVENEESPITGVVSLQESLLTFSLRCLGSECSTSVKH